MTALEFQDTGHPDTVGVVLDNLTLAIVQDAPVPHQGSTGRGGDQFIERVDAVSMGHSAGILVGWNRRNSPWFRRRVLWSQSEISEQMNSKIWINLPPGLIHGRQI